MQAESSRRRESGGEKKMRTTTTSDTSNYFYVILRSVLCRADIYDNLSQGGIIYSRGKIPEGV